MGFEKVSLGPLGCRRDMGMEAQTGPVNEELCPPAPGWGTPAFYGGEVLSFHSQSFRSVSEMKER